MIFPKLTAAPTHFTYKSRQSGVFLWGCYYCSRHLEESGRMGLQRTTLKQSLSVPPLLANLPAFLVYEKLGPSLSDIHCAVVNNEDTNKTTVCFYGSFTSPVMSIVRFEPHLMSNLVQRWYLKPQEVTGTSGLPATGPGRLTPHPPLAPHSPPTGHIGEACRRLFFWWKTYLNSWKQGSR